ncbi:chromosomal replication initiator protein DnaA, partial [Streptomyces sp. SID5926]|nr:chromosomal replication initiator protein DnaA [Streptomyces sp. SID5926]
RADQLPTARPAYPQEYQRPEPGSWPRPAQQDDYGWQQQRLGFPERDPYASPAQEPYGQEPPPPYSHENHTSYQQDYRPQPPERPSYDAQRGDYEPSRGEYEQPRGDYEPSRVEYDKPRGDYDQQRGDYEQRGPRRDLPEPPPGSGHVHRGG